MIKFVPISAVHNYVSDIVKQTTAPDTMTSWALQSYNRIQTLGDKEIVVIPIEIVNHKAYLPNDVVLIHDVVYTEASAAAISSLLSKEVLVDKLLLYQRVIYENLPQLYGAMRLHYLGQNKAAIIDNELYCNHCSRGFSLNHEMTCMTIDFADGTACLVYERKIVNNGNYLIPDDSTLLLGLASFIEATYWKNKMYSHEQNALNFYQEALQRSEQLILSYESNRVLRKVDVEAQNQFTFARNKFSA